MQINPCVWMCLVFFVWPMCLFPDGWFNLLSIGWGSKPSFGILWPPADLQNFLLIDDALFGQQAISEALVRWHPAARLSWVGLKAQMTTEHSPQLPLWKMTLSLVEPCRLKWPSILDRAWCFGIDICRYVHVALACFAVFPVGRCENSRWTKTSAGKITQSIHSYNDENPCPNSSRWSEDKFLGLHQTRLTSDKHLCKCLHNELARVKPGKGNELRMCRNLAIFSTNSWSVIYDMCRISSKKCSARQVSIGVSRIS